MTAGTTYFDPGRFRATAPIPSPLREKIDPSTSGGPFRRVRPTASTVGGGKAGGTSALPRRVRPIASTVGGKAGWTPALPGRVRPTASSIGGEGDSGPGVVPSIFQPAEVDSSPDR